MNRLLLNLRATPEVSPDRRPDEMGTLVAEPPLEGGAPGEFLAMRCGEFCCEVGMHSALLSVLEFTDRRMSCDDRPYIGQTERMCLA